MRWTHSFRAMQRMASMLVFALAVAGPVAAQIAPPVGPYGYVLNATFNDPSTQGGAATLGVMNFDGVGGVSGPYTFETGGHPQITGTFTGTYTSNPDGSGTISGALDSDAYGIIANVTLAMVINDHSRGLQLGVTSCVGLICDLSGSVVSGVGEIGSQHPVHDVGILNGSYGMQSTKSSPTLQTSFEVWSFDGAGGMTMSGTYLHPCQMVESECEVSSGSLSGTYSVDRDGTGIITVSPPDNPLIQKQYAFVITNGHSGLLALQLHRAGDGVLYLTGKLQ